MIENKRTECEESQRSLIATKNGIAAILWIQERYADAEKEYLDTLKLFEKNSKAYQIGDKYQRIHVCRNLAELIEKHGTSYSSSSDRNELLSAAQVLEMKYTNKFKLAFMQAKKSYLELYVQNKPLLSSQWWASVLDVLIKNDRKKNEKNKDDELSMTKALLIRRVESTISSFASQASTKWTFQDLRGLLLCLDREMTALKDARENMRNIFEEHIMKQPPSDTDIYAKGQCFRCSGHMLTASQRKSRRKNGTYCQHCRA
jgi:hypothetical protein